MYVSLQHLTILHTCKCILFDVDNVWPFMAERPSSEYDSPLCEPVWPSGKAVQATGRTTSVRFPGLAVLALRKLWFMDTV